MARAGPLDRFLRPPAPPRPARPDETRPARPDETRPARPDETRVERPDETRPARPDETRVERPDDETRVERARRPAPAPAPTAGGGGEGGGGGGGGGGGALVAYFDGSGAAGPEGWAGAGVVVRAGGAVVGRRAVCVGQGATNNQAEYVGAWNALEAALRVPFVREVEVRGDSMLVLKQVTGEWRINEPTLRRLCAGLRALWDRARARGVEVRWVHVRRALNEEADALAREGGALRDPSRAQLPSLLATIG